MKPFFSLIIPCYNVSKFIDKGIKSLDSQTFKNFEVIFIDDCSTDNTYDILSEYKINSELNITLLKNDKNSGPGKSRNNGIKVANGIYITFMDSDDWLENTFFEDIHNCIIQNKADIVQCDFYRYYKEEKHWIKCTKNLHSRITMSDILAKTVSSLWNLAIRKDLFNDLKIPELYNAEDVIIIPQLLSRANIIDFIHKHLYP